MMNYMRYRLMGGNKILKKGVLPRFNLPKSDKQNSTQRRGIIKVELDIAEANVLNQVDGTAVIKSEPELPNIARVLPESNILSEMDGSIVIKTESDLLSSNSVLSEATVLRQIDDSIIIKAESDLLEANMFNQAEECIVTKTEPVAPESEFHLLEAAENQMEDCIFIKVEPDSIEAELESSEINKLSQVETNSDMREQIFQYLYNPEQHTLTINPRNESSEHNYSQNSNQLWRRKLLKKSKGLKFPYILDQEFNGINHSESPVKEDLLLGINHDFQHMFTSSSDDTGTGNKCIQTNLKPRTRSGGIMCHPRTRDAATSPARRKKQKILITDEDWLPESSDSEVEEVRIEILKDSMFETRTRAFIENDSLLFLGVPKNSIHVIKHMQKRLNIPIEHIYCVLKKIRLNLSNEVLSYDFGLSNNQISKIFKKTVPLIAKYLKKYIFWPEEKVISENLPVQFRNKLRKVQSILNIFEIKMERSTLVQGLRLPSYESIETAKFLVSSTPSGFINFVSTRYNKGNSDVTIVKTSGFLDILPVDVAVLSLADCGFKYVDNVLRRKNCRFIRLPSISMRQNCTAETKCFRWLASVRIHVKRVMNQLRNFKILESNINLGKRSESLLDDIVIIAAALCNIQLCAENDAI